MPRCSGTASGEGLREIGILSMPAERSQQHEPDRATGKRESVAFRLMRRDGCLRPVVAVKPLLGRC